ncbi:uncharacterized protein [Euwallacea fornicatus]|uniref:uncharacterized protein n=1 Tax=Euwallacea fornicatus TaxID=995702 RepID=UPI00338D9DE8
MENLLVDDPTSEVEFNREQGDSAQWRALLEAQNKNMLELIKAVRFPQPSVSNAPIVSLPKFNPDNPDSDADAWSTTLEMCFSGNPLKGENLSKPSKFENKRAKNPGIKCHSCGKLRHKMAECRVKKDRLKLPSNSKGMTDSMSTRRKTTCFKCGDVGHIFTVCPKNTSSEKRVNVSSVMEPIGKLVQSGKRCNNLVVLKGIGNGNVNSPLQTLSQVQIDDFFLEMLFHVIPDDCLKHDVLISRDPIVQGFNISITQDSLIISRNMTSGFHQIPIHPNSTERTVFVTPDGQYEFLVMPFGLKNAPSVFERAVMNALGDLAYSYVIVYMDYTLIVAPTISESIERLQKTKIEYLGYEVEGGKVSPNPRKVQALVTLSPPRTVTQSFDFDIEYREGERVVHVDFLPQNHPTQPLSTLNRIQEQRVNFADISENWLLSEQQKDDEGKSIITRLHNDDIPDQIGWEETLDKVYEHYWFENMSKYVRKFVENCISCKVSKPPSSKIQADLLPIPKVVIPWNTKINLHLIATGSSRANGQVETVMSTLKNVFTEVEASNLSWQDTLDKVELALNCTINRITKANPLKLLISKTARPIGLVPYEDNETIVDITELRSRDTSFMQQNALYDKKKFDNNKSEVVKFKAGDHVLLRNEKRHQIKLDPKYKGPFVITDVLEGDRYNLKSFSNNRTYKYSHENLRKLLENNLPGDDDSIETDAMDQFC